MRARTASADLQVAWRSDIGQIALGVGLGQGKRARTLLDRDAAQVMLDALLVALPRYDEDEQGTAVFEEIVHQALDRASDQTGLGWHPRRRRIGLHFADGERCRWVFLEHKDAIVLADELAKLTRRFADDRAERRS